MHQIDRVMFPEMRLELINCAESLSNVEYQRYAWGKYDSDSGRYDDFDVAVHFLFDDARLHENLDQAVGTILLNDEEAKACRELISAIRDLLSKYGNDLGDQEYRGKPEWNLIVAAARALKKLLSDT